MKVIPVSDYQVNGCIMLESTIEHHHHHHHHHHHRSSEKQSTVGSDLESAHDIIL